MYALLSLSPHQISLQQPLSFSAPLSLYLLVALFLFPVLYITCSHYGRADLTLECTAHPLITASCDEWGLKDGPCVANPEELLRKTQKACDGKSSCSFQANYKVTGHPLTNCDYNPTSGDVAACFWLGEVCPHQVKNAVYLTSAFKLLIHLQTQAAVIVALVPTPD